MNLAFRAGGRYRCGVDLHGAQAVCRQVAENHYENFPVGRFIPAKIRPHVHAIYAFARGADDFADEPEHEGHRLERLSEWRNLLERASRGEAKDPVFTALAHSIRTQELPTAWLGHLLDAFESDVRQSRHASFEDLLAYSRNSANPIGRLVLWLHGYRDEARFAWSDDICTALQLANFWQDVAVDGRKDRVYLPQQDLAKFGYSEADLAAGVVNPAFRDLMAHEIARTRALFWRGRPLCDAVSGRLRFELRLVWHGGMRILEKIEAHGYDIFRRRPVLRAADHARLAWRSLVWTRT